MHQMHQMHQMHHPDPDYDYDYHLDLDPDPEPPRRKSHRRKPELNINTFAAANANEPPGLTTPLSPPPPPQLPYKSSSRSLRSSANAASTVTISPDSTSPYSSRRHPPVSSKGKQAAANRYASSSAKLSAQAAFAAHERDARHADPESGTNDPEHDWAKHTRDNHGSFETFLDPLSPDDMSNKENDFPAQYDRDRGHTTTTTPPSRPQPRPRDSHDLSLSPRNVTRDSLLGNMLLSLDQFSMGQMNCAQGGGETRTMSGFAEPNYYDDDDAPAAARTMTSTIRAPPRRAHGHGHSYSSDYDDNSSTVSRGQRSNSSSTGFQSNLGRINSMREMSSSHRNTNGTPGSRPLHSRGGRGSKSSSTNSIDAGGGYAQVLSSQRRAHGLGAKRSSSFELARRPSFGVQSDQHHQQNQLNSPQQHQHQRRPWQLELSDSFGGDDYDAAPTPTVPVGPRRLPNMPSMPSFHRAEPMGEPLSPVRSINLERKRSNKSSRSTNTNRQNTQSRFNPRDAPPVPTPAPPPASVPTLELDAAPAPHVGYEKAKEPVHSPAPNSVPQPKERPGFFKRMFGGGSKNSVVAALDQSANSTGLSNSFNNSAPPSATTMGSSNSNQVSSQSKSGSNPPSRGSQNHSSHGLQKKPSSFFRRRKKSVSVADADLPRVPPMLAAPTISPVQLPPAPSQRLEVLTPHAQPSPVTSLRKAMDPYLTHSGSSSGLATPRQPHDDLSPAHHFDADSNRPLDRNVRSFSPDYEPDPMATIRSVPSESRGREANASAGGAQRVTTPLGDPPRPLYGYERTGSFLHDNSESEESPPRVRKQDPQSSVDGLPRTPNDVVRSSLAPLQTNQPMSSTSLNTTMRDKKMDRMTQDSLSTIKSERHTSLQLPIEGALTDPKLNTRTSAASIPSLMVEDSEPNSKVATPKPDLPLDEPYFVVGDPTEDDRAKARNIFDGNEEFILKDKAASWMGEEGLIRQRVLQAYMDLYDFKSKNIVTSLRDVCNRLVLRAETQQVDRILVAFSRRWCNCNPKHGFKSTDVIHTICYSIMLLNTDLHMADIEQKMTRSQFIKNTMTTIVQALGESVPDMFSKRGSVLPGKGLNLDDGDGPAEHERSSFRNSFVKFPMRAGSALGDAPTELDDCGPLVKSPFEGSLKAWESQMEHVLKDTYASIRDERLPLFGAEQPTQEQQQPSGGLSVIGMLKRSPSVLSKAPSENPSTRGRVPDSMRASNSRWSSKSRSRPRGFGSAGFSSSRTSFDDGQSMWSPVESNATWSRASLGRTQTSMSMDSFGSHFTRGGGYQQSIGFANALSQAIIREDPVGSVQSLVSDELKPTQLLDDESLELAGPPWVKEGMVVHKHHLDGVDKKAKERNWSEVFAVIQKGTVSIFSFTPNKSTARRGRNAQNIKKGAVVGGGNWQENATSLGSWSLRLALASALPPPGYSKQRPHVWALSLPTGAVHLFHVGTPEICKEFVTTANYWSARLSTHPLIGGVSNMEYGWSDAIINNALVTAINENSGSTATGTAGSRQRSNSAVGRSSMHSRGSSFRSVGSFDFGSSTTRGDMSNKLPGDRITISEWMPPTQSMRPSNSAEKEQLETLLKYVKGIEDELQQHNSLRSPMLLAFSPRGPNVQKAMANWERKSSYLLREIVKFRTYVDCLQHAEVRKAEIWREREVARRAARGSLDLEDDANDDDGGNHIARRDWDDGGSDREHQNSIYDEPVIEEGDLDATIRARS